VLVTLAVVLVLALRLLPDAPPAVGRLGWVVLGLIALQGVIGYAQYLAGLPAGLVWVHVANSALIWIAVIRLNFALRDRGPLQRTVSDAADQFRLPSRTA
jgi:cytochrome c oxidase assembly protein subunit 15